MAVKHNNNCLTIKVYFTNDYHNLSGSVKSNPFAKH